VFYADSLNAAHTRQEAVHIEEGARTDQGARTDLVGVARIAARPAVARIAARRLEVIGTAAVRRRQAQD
jgi:hypothetical protein